MKELIINPVTLIKNGEELPIHGITDTSKVIDVQVNDYSIVSEGVARIPIAGMGNTGSLGVIRGGDGVTINDNGRLSLSFAGPSAIANRTAAYPLQSGNLDYAVKTALTDGKGAAYTDAEQLAARQRIGIDKPWTLKGVLTEENVPSNIGVDVDLTGCTELVITGTYTSTGSANLSSNVQTLADSYFTNASRTGFIHFRDTQWGIEPIVDKYRGAANVNYVYGNGTAAAWLNGRHISEITNIRSSTQNKIITACNIEIWAR